jgi:hypothetical protein
MDASQPLTGESAKAFAALCVYRDLGPQRSLAVVARSLAKSTTLVARWSSQWSWVERVAAWDAQTAQRIATAQQDDLVEMADRHGRIARALLGKVVSALVAIDPTEIGPSGLVRMFEAGVKAERESRAVGASHSETNPPAELPHPIDDLSVEERFARLDRWKTRLEAAQS